MSKKREIDQLVKKASRQGLQTTYLSGAGHWEIKNPETDEKVHLSSTPRSDRSVTSAKKKMERIGFVSDRQPRRKQRKERIVTEERRVDVPAIGDIVQLQEVVSAADVNKDIPLAAYVVWQAIQNRMTQNPDSDPFVWMGFQHEVIRELWPNLDNTTIGLIAGYLRETKNVRHSASMDDTYTGTPIYIVSHEFNTEKEIEVNTADTLEKIAAVAAAPKPSPLGLTAKGEPRLKAPSSKVREGGKWENLKPNEKGLYVCNATIGEMGCRFATEKLASFTSHQGKLKKKHPDELDFNGQCRFCTDFYPTAIRLSDHTRRIHSDESVHFCSVCREYYEGSSYAHRSIHSQGSGLSIEQPEVTEPIFQADMNIADVRVPVREIPMDLPEPEKAVGHTRWVTTAHKEAASQDAITAIMAILEENSSLKKENAVLSDVNGLLSKENARLREQEAKYAKISALLSELK